MSSIDKFTNILQELLNLKPPGVSGSRIKKLQEIALSNVSSESVLIQRLFTHCLKTPPSHKLGAIYVVDSIVRAFHDKAKHNKQDVNVSGEGTYGAAVNRIAELIEPIMDDALGGSPLPGDQKDKLRKLVEIWDKASTFDSQIIRSIRDKYFGGSDSSKTPPGSPPVHVKEMFKEAISSTSSAASTSKPDTASILQALASIAKQKPQTPPSTTTTTTSASGAAAVAGQPWNLPQPSSSSTVKRSRSRSRSPSRTSDRDRMRTRSPPPARNNENESESDLGVLDPSQYKPRNIRYATDLPQGYVRVSSRTLFIGGVPTDMNQADLEDQFTPFARVQSMVFHKEKRHAFVKVFTRAEAEISKERFESLNKTGGSALRVRWGVGFGPRDCCNYQLGVSEIPLSRLTDADKKWMVSAENGGTGGRPLVSGIEVEEPDIEIGSGVSSKAISKRMPTNSTRNGPRSNRNDRNDNGHSNSYSQNKNSPLPNEIASMINSTSSHQQQPPQAQAQAQAQAQQPQAPQPPMQMPQFNPMQMMQMMQSGQMPPQFQQMAAFFQQQQQQQQQQPPPQ